MIMRNNMNNINKTKQQVDKLSNQMTTQKKISKASEDPVVAIRSLRLRTSLNETTQYLDNNITDATSWLESTETAVTNLVTTLDDIRTQCNQASQDSYSTSNRSIILSSLKKLREQIYSEANADLNGRTLFTGYKTNKELSFLADDPEVQYNITQTFSADDIATKRYYPGKVDVPNVIDESKTIPVPDEVTNNRLRLDYDDLEDFKSFEISVDLGKDVDGNSQTLVISSDATGAAASAKVVTEDKKGNVVSQVDSVTSVDDTNVDTTNTDFDSTALDKANALLNLGLDVKTMSYSQWEANDFAVGDNEILLITDTGEIAIGSDASKQLKSNDAQISVNYDKTGFKAGELRPEYYYDCTEFIPSSGKTNVYTKTEQHIKYTISNNTTFEVNLEASEFMTADIGRDVDELIEAVQAASDADDKVAKIEAMIEEAGDGGSTYLNRLLEQAKKEQTYATDNEQKMFGSALTSMQTYLDRAALAKTTIGNKMSQLTLVKNRMTDQKTNVKSLLSTNEDEALSDIIINYTAAYNTYESALGAVSKASSTTLLDYIS
jgi:flagellar hook-associated protein 3 FlgL